MFIGKETQKPDRHDYKLRHAETQFGSGTYTEDVFKRCGFTHEGQTLNVNVVPVSHSYYEWALKYPNGNLVYINPYDQEKYDDGKLGITNKK